MKNVYNEKEQEKLLEECSCRSGTKLYGKILIYNLLNLRHVNCYFSVELQIVIRTIIIWFFKQTLEFSIALPMLRDKKLLYDILFAEFFFESEFAFEILTEQKINTLRIGFVDIILLV